MPGVRLLARRHQKAGAEIQAAGDAGRAEVRDDLKWERAMTNNNHHEPLLQFFSYDHLPDPLRAVSAPFGHLARELIETLPRNPERTVALRKLLEAKDCAVRAKLFVSA